MNQRLKVVDRRVATPEARAGLAPESRMEVHQALVEHLDLTDAFCRDHLDDESGALCRKLAGVLARKRPSPRTRGKSESWASGIVRSAGWANFLGDPTQPIRPRYPRSRGRAGPG